MQQVLDDDVSFNGVGASAPPLILKGRTDDKVHGKSVGGVFAVSYDNLLDGNDFI